jgi:hypothetical protein
MRRSVVRLRTRSPMDGRQPAAGLYAEREKNVHIHGHRRSGRRFRESERLTPEQRAATFKQALIWRQRWRDETGAGKTAPDPAETETIEARKRTNGSDRAKFAAGIARAEFGRFYWDERKAGPTTRRQRRKEGQGRDE